MRVRSDELDDAFESVTDANNCDCGRDTTAFHVPFTSIDDDADGPGPNVPESWAIRSAIIFYDALDVAASRELDNKE